MASRITKAFNVIFSSFCVVVQASDDDANVSRLTMRMKTKELKRPAARYEQAHDAGRFVSECKYDPILNQMQKPAR